MYTSSYQQGDVVQQCNSSLDIQSGFEFGNDSILNVAVLHFRYLVCANEKLSSTMKALFAARKCQPALERDNISNPPGCLHKNRALEKGKVGAC